VVLAVVVAVPAAAATTGWDPFSDPDRPAPAPTTSEEPVAKSLVEMLSVLRRPQTAEDRSAPVRHALGAFDRDEVQGVQLADVRLLPHGAVLVPVKRFAPGPDGDKSRHRRDDAVCLYSPEGDTGRGGWGACSNAEEVRAGQAIGSQGDVIYGVVPDGVARVRVVAVRGQMVLKPSGDGETGTSALEQRTVEVAVAKVRNNYFVVAFPRPGERRYSAFTAPSEATWLDAAGRVVKRIDYSEAPSG